MKTRSVAGFLALLCAWLLCYCLSEGDAAETYSFVKAWPEVSEGWDFGLPHHVAVDPQGNVFVADSPNNRIQKFDSSGKLLTKWGSFGHGDGEFVNPRGIAVDSSGKRLRR